jgi:glycosyltransferase involved in cell wall biosynthesis
MRGRLSAGQQLVLTHSEPATSALAAELGAPEFQGRDFSLYVRFPASWLDPVEESGKSVPEVAGARQWPRISVVMVSFNQAAFLEEGLRSVLDQGYPNLEFLVVDGMSTDGSIDILERYRDRLSFLLIEKDKGQSDGLNKGFARATGDIVTWVNSDDLLEPGALFRVAQAFAAHRVDMVVGGCRQIGLTRDKVIRNHHSKLPYGLPVALPLGLLLEMDRFWLTASFFYQPEVFFSRDIWNRSGGRLRLDLNYVLDYDLWVRMAAAGATIVHIPEFLACSRTHDQQKTVAGMPYLPEVQRLLREYGDRLATPPT